LRSAAFPPRPPVPYGNPKCCHLAGRPGCEPGNHAWNHADLARLSEAEINAEIEQTEAMLLQQTSTPSHLFRPPSGRYNDQVRQIMAGHGMSTIQWDSVTGDPDPNCEAATVLAETRRTICSGSILITDANGRGWHTAEALPAIIQYLQGQR